MRAALTIDDKNYDPQTKDKHDAQVKEFQSFALQVLPILRGIQKSVAQYMSTKSRQIADYKLFLSILNKYEENNLANYVEGDAEKMVFQNDSEKGKFEGETHSQQSQKLNDSLKNPYFNIYHWVKGEIFDILAVFNACDCKDKTQDRVNKTVKKKKNAQEDIDNLTTGKKTLSTLLKN